MRESDAWLLVAERFIENPDDAGLCISLARLVGPKRIPLNLSRRMSKRLHNLFEPDGRCADFWPEGEIDGRLIACGLLSAIAADEERAVDAGRFGATRGLV